MHIPSGNSNAIFKSTRLHKTTKSDKKVNLYKKAPLCG